MFGLKFYIIDKSTEVVPALTTIKILTLPPTSVAVRPIVFVSNFIAIGPLYHVGMK